MCFFFALYRKFISAVLLTYRVQLLKTIFPIGHLLKSRVKEIAKNAGLSVAQKKESMGLCFVGRRRRFGEFLGIGVPANVSVLEICHFITVELSRCVAQYIDQRPGLAVTDTGKVIGNIYIPSTVAFCDLDQTRALPGEHKGLFTYTVGQGAHIRSCSEKYAMKVSTTLNSGHRTFVLTHIHSPSKNVCSFKRPRHKYSRLRPRLVRFLRPPAHASRACLLAHAFEYIHTEIIPNSSPAR